MARDLAHPTLLLAGVERPAPSRTDFANEIFSDPAR